MCQQPSRVSRILGVSIYVVCWRVWTRRFGVQASACPDHLAPRRMHAKRRKKALVSSKHDSGTVFRLNRQVLDRDNSASTVSMAKEMTAAKGLDKT